MRCWATRSGVRNTMRKDCGDPWCWVLRKEGLAQKWSRQGFQVSFFCCSHTQELGYCEGWRAETVLGDRLFYTGPPSGAEELAEMLLQGRAKMFLFLKNGTSLSCIFLKSDAFVAIFWNYRNFPKASLRRKATRGFLSPGTRRKKTKEKLLPLLLSLEQPGETPSCAGWIDPASS